MEQLIREKWNFILETMKEEYEIQDISFKTWILPLQLYSVDNNVAYIIAPMEHMGINYIEKKYLIPLKVTIGEVIGGELDVKLVSEKDIKDNSIGINSRLNNQNSNTNEAINMGLKPNYTFETFVVGNNNNLAHAAALAVAETPGHVYNPLFIYGGAGLGKTHLMQAIAHFIMQNNPDLKVLYVTSETFTNELIESLKNQKMTNQEFRNKYRNIDVLLIDDIQFIIGKESTQEEFFHTFNALYDSNKQIVISSDKPPKEMETLTERLRTRFEMGLTADIQIPTYETKMAILNKKSEAEGYVIPDDVKDYVATHIKSSIRELEGALTKLVAFSNLSHQKLTVEFAEDTLKDLISPEDKREVTPELIIQIVADHFNLTPEDIISQKRNAEISKPRQIAMYLCRTMTDTPLEQIGRYFGNRDHTTILHGYKKVNKEVTNSIETRSLIEILIKKINPS
ncbi:MAG: chromosomal replication initiator protein DnaA [Clostridia bacterium]|nr:chromosomal replication initiator protein DnaA [Clostridia bacterium]